MPVYKQTKGPKGRSLWFKDGKMISVKDIPSDILATMEPQKPVSDQLPEFRKCIFCGELGTERKLINHREVDLCFHHYDTKTTGEVVAQLREGLAYPA